MNRLANEVSPYLRQHKDNPVDWYAWGDEAFAAAAERGVPILLSVGYSACHWCHVMAHECFEDAEVAREMNVQFVNVKVDREERPDVDAVYMEAVQALTGRGGWPMTVFLTPDGKPFYGGTYFPKPSFLQLMAAITDVWQNRRDDVDTNVNALMDALSRSEISAPASVLPGSDLLDHAVGSLAANFDREWGGFGAAPKFPSTMNVDLLLRSWTVSGNVSARDIAVETLDAMAAGGMHDHLGGGFARYSVDRQWLVPHFEKMLYDQALLLRIYVHAAVSTGEERFSRVAHNIVSYVLRDLRHPEGGFYSAEDADSADLDGHHHEGWFYTWTPREIRSILPSPVADLVTQWFGITESGNFEGRNILTRHHSRSDYIPPSEISDAMRVLFETRTTRPRPLLDNKVLTEWNGLMLSSLAEAAFLFDNDEWLAAALVNGEFLLRELRTNTGRWQRSWHEDGTPRARHAALAADLAAIVDAFTRLGEASGESRWVGHAVDAADQLLDNHWDPELGGLFTTANDAERLVVRQKDLLDNATPSANSLAAVALLRLGALTGESRFANHADRILQLLDPVMRRAPSAAGNSLAALHLRLAGVSELVIPGPLGAFAPSVRRAWRPNLVLAWGETDSSPIWEGRTAGHAYLCHDHVCMSPSVDAASLDEQLAPSHQ
jgi:uncharacterized protein